MTWGKLSNKILKEIPSGIQKLGWKNLHVGESVPAYLVGVLNQKDLMCVAESLHCSPEIVTTLLKGCCWAVKDVGILGLRRRGIQSGASDEAWSLRAFV